MAPEFNLHQRPSGEIERLALLDYIRSTDDRIERHFLEVKSDVDLNLKSGRGKVAKFILGAANRDPAIADGYFEGHALMVLGAAHGIATGIEGFEAKDLHRDVTAWIGTDGPRWGFDRIPLDGSRDVIVVDVWPPTGDIWACRADGDDESVAKLKNGELYLRVEGETRAATGDEKHAMFARLRQTPRKPLAVSVEVAGYVGAVGVDLEVLDQAIAHRAQRMRDQAEKRSSSKFSYSIIQDRRSLSAYHHEVDVWESTALIRPAAGVMAMEASRHPGIQIEVGNSAKRFMQDVQVEVKFDGNVFALEPDDDDEELPLFPGAPIPWGGDTAMSYFSGDSAMFRALRSTVDRDSDRKVLIKQVRPAVLTIDMRALRPHEVFTIEPRELALVMLVEDESEPPSEILCTYQVTASNLDDDIVLGEFMIPVEYHDWRESIAEMLEEGAP